MNLTKHKVLVTGGSKGIGFELARNFVALGNKVVICGRNEDALLKAKSELGEIETIQCDLSDPKAVFTLVDQVKEKLGGLSILVNNAGVQKNYSLISGDTKKITYDVAWEIQTNLTAVINLTSLCLPMLKSENCAAIINVSSGLAITPKASAPVYCASKAAIHSFTQSLRYQCEKESPCIQVFEVVPPLVDTDMTYGRGAKKLSPKEVANEAFRAFKRNKHQIYIGKVKLLAIIHRISPALSGKILRNS